MASSRKEYQLPSTHLIPNSPYPLLHYPGFLSDLSPLNAQRVFADNGWDMQWIYRYGPTQTSHYHSTTHECMAVLSGQAVIRFGAADTTSDLEESTHGSGYEQSGVTVAANAGDVFVIPAGVSHKTYDTAPSASFKLLTPGEGHGLGDGCVEGELAAIQLDGFTMLGAYPSGSVWDFCSGGEHEGAFEKVWNVPKPDRDPVLGLDLDGLVGRWT